jgi:hypothetical protein
MSLLHYLSEAALKLGDHSNFYQQRAPVVNLASVCAFKHVHIMRCCPTKAWHIRLKRAITQTKCSYDKELKYWRKSHELDARHRQKEAMDNSFPADTQRRHCVSINFWQAVALNIA